MRIRSHIKQLAGESMIYGIPGTISKLVGFFLIPLYTRVFTTEEYGIVALVDVLVGLLGMLAILGLDNASARWYYDSGYYDSEATEDRRVTIASWFWCQLATSTVLAALLFVMAPRVAILLGGSEEYTILIRLAAAALPLGAAAKVLGNWLRYQRRAWAAAAVMTLRSVGTVTLIVLFVLVWRQGLVGIYTARLIVVAAVAAVAVLVLRRWIAIGAFSLERLKPMLRFGLPLVPAAIGVWIMTSADRFVLLMYCTQAEVGLYDLAAKVAGGAALAIFAFQQAWGPFAYSILKEDRSHLVYAKVLDVYGFAACAMCTTIALLAPALLKVMATEAFYPAASCVAFLAFVYFLAGTRYIASLGTGIAKKSGPIALSIGVGAAANLGLNFLLVPRFGREGAAVATLAAYGASAVYLFAASQRIHHIPYKWRVTVVSVVFSWVLIALAWWLVPPVSPAGLAIRAGMLLLFVPLGIVLGLIRREYLRQLVGRAPTET
jgi:O-antigen/teichoic acid export membrane protein